MGLLASTDLTGTWPAIASLVIFVVAYLLVTTEDLTRVRKSLPVMMAAGLMWPLVALAGGPEGGVGEKVMEHVGNFAAVFLFLLSAMTYVNTIAERNVFLRLNVWLVSRGWDLRAVFWVTGLLAFFISPLADNLTTALVLGAVLVTVGKDDPRFVSVACVNVVVAANAGGAFSPFGDITTLMVWQAEKVETLRFLELLPASIFNWLIPAFFLSLVVPRTITRAHVETVELRRGWWVVIVLFIVTIITAVTFHALLHVPPFLGMTTGLSFLFVYGYVLQRLRVQEHREDTDLFDSVAAIEWDTMLFFFGVIMCVGALQELGYLAVASSTFYEGLGPFWANTWVGVLSAVVDNVPVMFGVLGMDPDMGVGDWLLVTLTAGVGGSLLSIGSAAGVGMMGVARGRYTFASHLRCAPVIALGYAASIVVHDLGQRFLFGG